MGQRIFGLDLLRCYAITLVVFFHGRDANLPDVFRVFFAQGYIGVSVFFVLSAWLVAAPLIRSIRDHGQVDLLHFWVMRWGKTIPPFLVFVALIGLLQVAGVDRSITCAPESVEEWWKVLTFRHNYIESNLTPLPALWSLAIEEQFYLVLPLVFVALTGRKRRMWFAAAVVAVCISPVCRYLAFRYYIPLTGRSFELQLLGFALGTVLVAAKEYNTALWQTLVKRKWLYALFGTGVLGIVQMHPITQVPLFGNFSPAVISLAVCFTLPALDSWHLQNRFIRWPVETLAKGTYAVYLVHDLAIALARKMLDEGWLRQVVIVTITGGLAFALYQLVEVACTNRRKQMLKWLRNWLEKIKQSEWVGFRVCGSIGRMLGPLF